MIALPLLAGGILFRVITRGTQPFDDVSLVALLVLFSLVVLLEIDGLLRRVRNLRSH
jgi:hypothetical protein